MKRPRPRAGDFNVGWICALDVELTAVKAILDEEYEGSDDTSQYTLGRIGIHNVVVGCLPAGQIGTEVAAAVATEIRLKLSSLRIGLVVGIGGGVPSPEVDIRLGDVVVSVPQRTYEGVVQYDFGNMVSGGLRMRTGSLNTPPSVLLTAVSNLRANIRVGRSNIPKHLASITKVPTFARCNAGPDMLFRSSFTHVEGTTCNGCNNNMVIRRPQQDTEQTVVHYGIIGSGNQVIKDAIERDRLSAELGGVLCFEMEAAGVMNILQCLVVRGICDYTDSHKIKRWQPFAAAAAAACAKEILSFVPAPSQHNGLHRLEFRQSGTMDNGESVCLHGPRMRPVESVSNAVMLGRRLVLTAEQRKRYLDALKFEQIEARYATIKTAHTKTCSWLLTKSEYQEWLDSDKLSEHHGLFWIKGNPGTGKSTIMKFASANVIRNSQKGASNIVVISFFFNTRGEELEKSVLGMY
jgi:nucleoside phosphorylase